MNKIYIINGCAGAGKDAFVKFVSEIAGEDSWSVESVLNIHSSDAAKEALTLLGWDGEKTPEVRSLLAKLTDYSYLNHIPKKRLDNQLTTQQGITAVFIHERDPKYIYEYLKHFPKAKTIIVSRDDSQEVEPDIWGLNNCHYDIQIENTGTLEELKEAAKQFCELEGL